METAIEIGYAGVVIGRVTVAGEIDDSGLFLPVADPLPVGTKVTLKIEGRGEGRPIDGRVVGVSESVEPGKAGMRVRLGVASNAAAGAPAAAAATTSSSSSSSAVPVTDRAPPFEAAPAPVEAAPPSAAAAGDAPAAGADAASDPADAAGGDGPGDGVPGADETAGNSGAAVGGGGGRRKRRRR